MVEIRQQMEKILQGVLLQTVPIVQQTVNNYLKDLEARIGKIPGTSGFSDVDLRWEPLDEDTESGHRFWYETGAVATHIIAKVVVDKNIIKAVVGLPKGAPGYREALWNEFGWTPHNSSRVVRRALFVPLAEHNLRELNVLLQQRFSKLKLRIRVNI
jgi:hypothetical protein